MMFKCGGKTKKSKKVKKNQNGASITIPVKMDSVRTGFVTYNPDGTRRRQLEEQLIYGREQLLLTMQ